LVVWKGERNDLKHSMRDLVALLDKTATLIYNEHMNDISFM